ncbi:MAG: delta-60 repeat domain-containing protein [Acidobacteriota bacterium]
MKQLHTHSAAAFIAVAITALVLAVGPLGRVNAGVGELDPQFGNGGKVFTHLAFGDRVTCLAFQPDGKIIAGGASGSRPIYDAFDFTLVRYQADGSLDLSFGFGGKVITDFLGDEDYVNAVAVQADGKIVAAGRARKGVVIYFGLARYNTDGSLDATFGSGGKLLTNFFGYGGDALAMAIQPDGRIVAAGRTFSGPSEVQVDFGVARYNIDGSLDATFGSGGKVATDFGAYDLITAMAIQPDGRIVAGGDTYTEGAQNDFALARYNKDGSLDSTFGSGGKVVTDFAGLPDFLAGLALQPDGKIVLAGDVSTYVSASRDDIGFGLARYNKDGSLDSSFGSGGKVITQGVLICADAVAIQPNGKVIAAGLAVPNTPDGDFALSRYNSNGSLDPGFGSGGIITTDFTPSDRAFALGLQSNGKVVAAGAAYDVTKGSGFALARYDFGDITTKSFDMHLQNDTCVLQLDSATGDYSFTDCASGFTIEGVGKIKVRGCKLILHDASENHDVWAKLNVCTHTGKTAIELFSQGMSYSLKDADITASVSPCR